jgi:hypothetical protein
MRKPKRDENAYAKAIAERDQAIADRDFILRFLAELGAALNGDAVAAAAQLLALRAMVRLAGEG